MALGTLLKTFSEVDEKPKQATKVKVGQNELKKLLQKKRAKMLREKTAWRMGKTFSPSSLTFGYCRRIKIAQLAGKVDLYYDKPAPALQTVFDLGNLYHDLVQGYFWQIGILKGSYECYKCDEIYHDLVSPSKCPKGHSSKYMKFKEVKMVNKDYKLSGRADGILVMESGEELVDIKSISNWTPAGGDREFVWEDLDKTGPKDAHIVQLMLYMFMADPFIKKGHLLYISKNKGKIKTFEIEFDHDIIDPYLREISHMLDKAEAWKAGKLKVEDLDPPCGKSDCPCDTILSSD